VDDKLMARKYTILQFADRLDVMRKGLEKAILPPLRKGQRDIVKALKEHYWRHDLAAKVWRWRRDKFLQPRSGPVVNRRASSLRARWSHSQAAYIAMIEVEGLAAKVEAGGRLRRHSIFGRSVRTPGAVVSRRPALDNITDRRFDQVVDDAQGSFNDFVDREVFI
jgi:hypothetical protein